MKRQCLIVLATVAAMGIGMGSLASVQGSDVVLQIPGFTIVQDAKLDLVLRRCDPYDTEMGCSLPPGVGLPDLPGYFDIKNTKIIQLGPKWVELSIALSAPIPAELPDWAWHIAYFWQFQGGCVAGSPEPVVDRAGVTVFWNGTEWKANWYMIITCSPERTIELSVEQLPFEFTKDGLKVRVELEDLLTAIPPGEQELVWHAGVRRIPFIWDPYTHTGGVDYAPNVFDYDPNTQPEEFATWQPRYFQQ